MDQKKQDKEEKISNFLGDEQEDKQNQKPRCSCGSKLGVVLAIVLTAVLVGGGVYYFLNQKFEGENEGLVTKIENEKKIIEECKLEKETCEKKNEKIKSDLPSGKYISIDKIIEFNYSTKDEPLYEKDGTIQFLSSLETARNNPRNFPEYQTVGIGEKKYVLRPFLESSDEGIMIINKEEQETLEDSIKRLIKEQGKNSDDCKVVKEQEGEKEKAWIELAQEHEPTEEELSNTNLPEEIAPTIKKAFAIGVKTRELCSNFSSAGGPGLSLFEYNSSKNKTTFIFKQSSGYDSLISFSSVDFLDKK